MTYLLRLDLAVFNAIVVHAALSPGRVDPTVDDGMSNMDALRVELAGE
jgi:hypothetical protein